MSTDKIFLNLYQRDVRFRAITDASVKSALEEHGVDNHAVITGQDVANVATRAVMIALSTAFSEDAELIAVRAELDHYRNLATKYISITPIVVPKK